MFNKLTKPAPRVRPQMYTSGFTAIELLVTIAVLGVLLALAIPSFVEFTRASRGSALSSSFVAGMSRARSEAISQNVCVKICQSANVNTVSNAASATCEATGDDWQRGWIIFKVPDCDTTLSDPVDSDVLAVRLGEQPDYRLFSSGSAVRTFLFEPRGVLISGNASNLTLSYLPQGTSSKHARTICVSFAGRVTVREWGLGCSG